MMREISLNVLDIAQNSVSAGASLIEIEVLEDSARDELVVIIKDNGCGMSEEKLREVVSPFYTTRTTRKVGLGVPFFKMAAELTGGSFLIDSKVSAGTTVKARFIPSHMDCMPLGDMTQTILALITLNESINFVYRRSKDKASFTLDTREIREVLEDVPLSSPEIVKYLTNQLEESENNILKGVSI